MNDMTPNMCGEDMLYVPELDKCNECDRLAAEFEQALEDAKSAVVDASEEADRAKGYADDANTYAQESLGYAEKSMEYAERAEAVVDLPTMTQEQADAGTSTAGYRISPKVLRDTITEYGGGAIYVEIDAISSLPRTVDDGRITANHRVAESTLSNASAQTSDWTVATFDGSLTISGSVDGTTTLSLILVNCN